MGIEYLIRAIESSDDQELFDILDEYDRILEASRAANEIVGKTAPVEALVPCG